GTTYGGNGVSTFQLPDLQGRVAIGFGNGHGLSPYQLGQQGGAEMTSLNIQNIPSHNHTASLTVTISASAQAATQPTPATGISTISSPNDPIDGDAINLYSNSAPNIALNTQGSASGSTNNTGGGTPFSIIQPYLAVNYQIALVGIFPSRN